MTKSKLFFLLAIIFSIHCPCWSQVKKSQAAVIEDLIYQAQKQESNELGGPSKAIEICNQIIKLDKTNAKAYTIRARCKSDMGDKIGSVVDLTTAIKYTPTTDYLMLHRRYITRAQSKADVSDHRGAITDYNTAIDIINTSIKYNLESISDYVYLEYIILYRVEQKVIVKEYDSAVADMNLIMKLYPNSSFIPEYLYKKGNYLISLGKKNAACSEFSKAGELGSVKAYQAIRKYCQ